MLAGQYDAPPSLDGGRWDDQIKVKQKPGKLSGTTDIHTGPDDSVIDEKVE